MDGCNATAVTSSLREDEPALWAWLAAMLSFFFAVHLGTSLLLFLGRNAGQRRAGTGESLMRGPRGEGTYLPWAFGAFSGGAWNNNSMAPVAG